MKRLIRCGVLVCLAAAVLFAQRDINGSRNVFGQFRVGPGDNVYLGGANPFTAFNAYYSSGWKYGNASPNNFAFTILRDASGHLQFSSAPTGTPDAAITFDQNWYLMRSGVLAFGGLTSSSPGLDASGAVLRARLADSSGFARFQAAPAVAQYDAVTLDSSLKIDLALIPDLPASRITSGALPAAFGGLGVDASAFTGVVKMTAGVASVVPGTSSDCVKVDGSSGSCGTGGSGAGTAYSKSFTASASWVVLGSEHGQGTCHLVMQAFEDLTTSFQKMEVPTSCNQSTFDVTYTLPTAKTGIAIIGTGTTITGAYSADKTSATSWTVAGATHGLGTCDLAITPYAVSGTVQTKLVAPTTCDTATYDVVVTFPAAQVGRITLLKSGGAGSGGGGGGGGTLSNLNGQTGATQNYATGVSGLDFNISSGSNVHTFNIPSASTTARGLVTFGAQSFLGRKTFNVSASEAGLNVGSAATAPTVPINGDIWYDSTLGKFRCQENSATTDCIAAGSLPSPTGNGNKMLGVNAAGGGYELKEFFEGSAISITDTVGGKTFSVSSSIVCFFSMPCAFTNNHQWAATRADVPGAAQTLVAGTPLTIGSVMIPLTVAGNVTLTATPTIPPGVDGQLITIFGTANFTITLQGNGSLPGSGICGPNISLTQNRFVDLRYSTNQGCWMQRL